MCSHELLRRFETCEIPAGSFHHEEHVKVAWLYLSRYEPLVALAKFAGGLKRLAESFGATDKYHETITWAYMFLVHERMQRADGPQTWSEFASSNPDLLEWPNSVLDRYYSPETLQSATAKRCFVLPDSALAPGP